ncbi:MAG: hypothetical protein AAF264_07625 [Pseudomonadota bacterium]
MTWFGRVIVALWAALSLLLIVFTLVAADIDLATAIRAFLAWVMATGTMGALVYLLRTRSDRPY